MPCRCLVTAIGTASPNRRVGFWVLLAIVAPGAAPGDPAQLGQDTGWGAEGGPLLTVPPMLGFRFGANNPRLTVALPYSVQFGPLLKGERGEGLRPFRAVLEPGVAQSMGDLAPNQPRTGLLLRSGLRRVWNNYGIWGFGLGGGITFAFSRNMSHALSPEVLLTLGRCCSPGFVMLSIRYEYSISGQSELWTSLGFALW